VHDVWGKTATYYESRRERSELKGLKTQRMEGLYGNWRLLILRDAKRPEEMDAG